MDKGQRRADGLECKLFSKLDIKMRAGRTQAVTKDMTPNRDCKSRRETASA